MELFHNLTDALRSAGFTLLLVQPFLACHLLDLFSNAFSDVLVLIILALRKALIRLLFFLKLGRAVPHRFLVIVLSFLIIELIIRSLLSY